MQADNDQQRVKQNCFSSSGHFVEFPKAETERSIMHRLKKIVLNCPQQTAVKFHNRALSYQELDHASDCAAENILARPNKGNKPIALLLEQGIEVVVAIIGVLKTGGFYVRLDPSHPHQRLSSILQDSQASL